MSNPYREWGYNNREEYMLSPGGFHTASAESLTELYEMVDSFHGEQLHCLWRWVHGEPGSNWASHNANDAIHVHVQGAYYYMQAMIASGVLTVNEARQRTHRRTQSSSPRTPQER